jgi:multisubunit Na+/H+ antiporter MnhB subunit
MKLGITEMLVIGLVIMLIIGASRFFPMRSRQPEARPVRQLTAVEARDEEILRKRNGKGKLVGVILVVLGVALIVTAPSLIKYFFMSWIGGALILIIGLASLFFMSRRS